MASIEVPLTGSVDRLNPVTSPRAVVVSVPTIDYKTILLLALAGIAVYYIFFRDDDGQGREDFLGAIPVDLMEVE